MFKQIHEVSSVVRGVPHSIDSPCLVTKISERVSMKVSIDDLVAFRKLVSYLKR